MLTSILKEIIILNNEEQKDKVDQQSINQQIELMRYRNNLPKLTHSLPDELQLLGDFINTVSDDSDEAEVVKKSQKNVNNNDKSKPVMIIRVRKKDSGEKSTPDWLLQGVKKDFPYKCYNAKPPRKTETAEVVSIPQPTTINYKEEEIDVVENDLSEHSNVKLSSPKSNGSEEKDSGYDEKDEVTQRKDDESDDDDVIFIDPPPPEHIDIDSFSNDEKGKKDTEDDDDDDVTFIEPPPPEHIDIDSYCNDDKGKKSISDDEDEEDDDVVWIDSPPPPEHIDNDSYCNGENRKKPKRLNILPMPLPPYLSKRIKQEKE